MSTAPESPPDAGVEARRAELAALFAAVEAEPWAHDYYALLRRVDALRPEAPRTGQAQRPTQEALRLGQVPELDFAPAALASFQIRGNKPPKLGVRFFGLLGPQGAMPLHLTEYVRERLRQHSDPTLANFLDLFHHRLLSLFYRAWAQSQPTVHHDRPADDRYTAWLMSAAGLPANGSGSLPASALAFQAGLLSARSRHPEALCKVLRQYFGVPVALQPHVGQWLTMEADDRSRLGHAANRTERSTVPMAALGVAANAGRKVWDRQYKFRLLLGPLSLRQYMDFLPGGAGWRPLLDWVRLLAGPQLRWDLQLSLRPDDRPAPQLGRKVQLGVTCWLGRPDSRPTDSPQRPAPTPRRRGSKQILQLRPDTTFLLRRIERGTGVP